MIKKYLILIVTIIAIMFSIIPTPYYLVIPGQCIDISKYISVENGEKDAKGNFLLTSTALTQANIWLYLYSFIDPGIELKNMKENLPENISQEEYLEMMSQLMQDSQMISKIVALRKAGYFPEISGKGVIITQVLDKSPVKEKLMPGDLIVKVNEMPVETVEDFSDCLLNFNEGDLIKINFIRNNLIYSTHVPIINILTGDSQEEKLGIGIYIATREIQCKFPLRIEIDLKEIKGSSAGLIIALEILNQLTENDLSNGLMIAGTGNLNIDGSIKSVEGIRQKIISAKKKSADVFLVPEGNYQEAIKYSKNIKIIPIENFDEVFLMKGTKFSIPPNPNQLNALEDIIFVGYPEGIIDQLNIVPLFRKGSTATPYFLDFESLPVFLIDATALPGSSGSPVFLVDNFPLYQNNQDILISFEDLIL